VNSILSHELLGAAGMAGTIRRRYAHQMVRQVPLTLRLTRLDKAPTSSHLKDYTVLVGDKAIGRICEQHAPSNPDPGMVLVDHRGDRPNGRRC
jgi:hypothetical protein